MLALGCRGSVTRSKGTRGGGGFQMRCRAGTAHHHSSWWAVPTLHESLIPRRVHAQTRDEVGASVASHGQQLAAAGDAQALVQGLDVVVDRVLGQLQLR